MITNLRLRNFKGHRDTNLALKQLTLLVGDNGSGKSSVLEAIRFAARLPSHTALDEIVRSGSPHMGMALKGPGWSVELSFTYGDGYWAIRADGGEDDRRVDVNSVFDFEQPGIAVVRSIIGNVGLYRFQADRVASTSYSEQAHSLVEEDGAQTSVVLAGLKLADDDAFARIEEAMRSLVPSLRRIRIKPAQVLHPSNPNPVLGSKIFLEFISAKDVPAHQASQGTLVLLALLTVLHSNDRPKTILLDDFDHALHPRAQMELIRMIKGLLALDEFRDTQIIATTHSPYVLDEVEPSNVIAFALREDGCVASKPLSEHPDAAKVNGSLKAGELWTLDAERDWVR